MQVLFFQKMARIGAVLAVVATFSSNIFAQTDVKIGNNPGNKTASAVLELESTTKGFLLPRMTTGEMNAISTPANGLSIYNIETNCVYVYRNTAWVSSCDPLGLGAWSITGNNNIVPASNFLGTTTAQPIVFKTNSIENMRLTSAGLLGLGTATPAYKLDIDAITGAAGNPLRLQGLLAGAVTDSIVTSSAGILRRMTFAELLSGAGGLTADNGLTFAGTNMRLGGTLMQNTTIAQAGFNMAYTGAGNFGIGAATPAYKLDVDAITGGAGNPLRLQGLLAGTGTDSILTSNAGVVRRLSVAELLSAGNAWLNGGNALTGTGTFGTTSNHNFNIVTNGVTRLTFENNGNITQNGTGTVTFTGPVTATNGFNATGATTINTGTGGTTAIGNATSTTTVLGTTNINTTGAGVTNIGNATSTTNIDGTSLNVPNIPIVTTTTSNVMLTNPATGKVESITVANLVGNTVTADNGITKSTPNNFQLGGTLLKNTSIAQANFDMNFSGGKVAIGSTSAPVSTLQVTGSQGVSFRKVTTATTIDVTDYVVLANATAGVIVLTLPLASACPNRTYYVGKSDESVNTVTFSPALYLTETTTIASVNYAKKFKIVSDGTNWWIYNE
jgi:hypothetical protein